jgi:CDP-glycerol glycerophosphotransferase
VLVVERHDVAALGEPLHCRGVVRRTDLDQWRHERATVVGRLSEDTQRHPEADRRLMRHACELPGADHPDPTGYHADEPSQDLSVGSSGTVLGAMVHTGSGSLRRNIQLPRASIVVPIYNVEPFLQVCLDSLSSQTFRDFEAILVDDGSTDRSGEIAAAHAATDSRFRVLTQSNGGLSRARNAGVAVATGEYLGFLDSDDMVARHAYEMLVSGLDRTGSDFATANVRRLTTRGTGPSALHERAFNKRRFRTHIRKRPELIFDTTTWNKLFRREFWDRHDFAFAPGVLYEDLRVVTPAYFLADRVDVHSDPVFYWRRRAGGGERSITQRRHDLINLTDRMAAVTIVDQFVSNTQRPKDKLIHDRKVVSSDLLLYCNQLLRADDDFRQQFMKLVNGYLDGVDASVFDGVRSLDRLKYHFVQRRMMPELLDVLSFQEAARGELTPTRSGEKFYASNYPFRGDPAYGVPDDVYDVSNELTVDAAVREVSFEGSTLVLEGHAFITHLDVAQAKDQKLRLLIAPHGEPPAESLREKLQARRDQRSLTISLERLHQPAITEKSQQAAHCYDWAGFRARIDTDRLLDSTERRWSVRIEVRNGGATRQGGLRQMGDRSRKPPFRDLPDGRRIVVRLDEAGELELTMPHRTMIATHVQRVEGGVELRGETIDDQAIDDDTHFLLRRREGSAERAFPITSVRTRSDGSSEFIGRIDVGELLEEREIADRIAQTERFGGGLHWDAYIRDGSAKLTRLAVDPTWTDVSSPFGAREIVARATRRNLLTLTERIVLPVVTGVTSTDEAIVLTGRYVAPAEQPLTILLRRSGSTEQYLLPTTRDGETFQATLDPMRVERIEGTGPLGNGLWSVLAEDATDQTNAGNVVDVKLDAAVLQQLPEPRTFGRTNFAISTARYNSVVCKARPLLSPEEAGEYRQRQLQTTFFPAALKRPLRTNAIFCESWHGKQYSDSPRALYDALRARDYDPADVTWSLRDTMAPIPGDPAIAQYNSLAYYSSLATSGMIAVNDALPAWFQRRPDQTVLQTWHGTPLKRIGFDISQVKFATANYQDILAAEVVKWTHLISPAPFATEIMRRAFRFEGRILETGLPRNDLFFSAQADDIRAAVRARLGIPDGTLAVLYAPTWRDDDYHSRGRYRFEMNLDLQRARAALGSDVVFLIRTHHLIADSVDLAGVQDFARNVSDWPDIQELYLASDVLVTDYSSVFFDFAVTGRPIIFFAYDLENYRDRLRGFYLDFDEIAPGPIVRTSDEVIDAVSDLAAVSRSYAERYAGFRAEYNAWDDGFASDRVLQELLGS